MTTEDIIRDLELLDKKLNTITDFYCDNLWERSLINMAIQKLKDLEHEIDSLYERIAYSNGRY
jgi:uncharacterized protein Yka (UPF0111/DUF47 family)